MFPSLISPSLTGIQTEEISSLTQCLQKKQTNHLNSRLTHKLKKNCPRDRLFTSTDIFRYWLPVLTLAVDFIETNGDSEFTSPEGKKMPLNKQVIHSLLQVSLGTITWGIRSPPVQEQALSEYKVLYLVGASLLPNDGLCIRHKFWSHQLS